MFQPSRTFSRLLGMLVIVIIMTACSASTPAEESGQGDQVASADPAAPTEVPATDTAVPPTETAVPPTETAEPTATSIPPTETAEPTAAPESTATSEPTATPFPPLSGSGGGVIAYVSQPEEASGIQIMNADGTDQHRLTDSLDSHPTWSPDGSKIAFTTRSGSKEDGWGIYEIDLSTGEVTLMVKNDGNTSAADWSPDGERFAVTNLYEINLATAGSSKFVRISPPGSDHLVDFADWSPDGSKLVYTAADMVNNYIYDIYSSDSNGSKMVQLTFDQGNNSSPVWSPDGSLIAFESDRDGGWEIFVMNADGSGVQNISNSPDSREQWPSWSPDGTKIAFQTDRDGNWEIYVMNADGSEPQRLTENDFDDMEPAWRP